MDISQKELNTIYNDVNTEFKTGMISKDYYITKYTTRGDELVFTYDRKLKRWTLLTEIELVEDEQD